MHRRWRALALRLFAACLAAACLSGPLSMVAMAGMPMPAPNGQVHHGGHGSRPGHQHQGHQQTECCDSCVAHCSAHLVNAESEVPTAPPGPDQGATGFRDLDRAGPHHAQLRLPPSQAPPALPG